MKIKIFCAIIIFTLSLFTISCKSGVSDGLQKNIKNYEIVSNAVIQDSQYIKIKNKKTNKYGYIDFKGNIILETEYGKSIYENDGIILAIKGKEDVYYITPNDKKNHSEINGKKIIGGELFKDGYSVVEVKGVQGNLIIDKNFDQVFGEDNKYKFMNIGDGYFIIYENLDQNSNIGIYNAKTNKITKTKLNISASINDEYFLSENEKGNFYFVNKENMNVIKNREYKYVVPFESDFSLALDKDDNIVKIAKNGDIIKKLNLTLSSENYIESFIPSVTSSKIILNNLKNNTSAIYDFKDDKIIETKYKFLGCVYGKYVVFRDENYYGVGDLNSNEILKAEYDKILLHNEDAIILKNDSISHIDISALNSLDIDKK